MFGRNKVLMVASVGDHEAGTKVWIKKDLADLYILKGYAEGVASRAFTSDEIANAHSLTQKVQV
jgi:hypothetical protein